MPGENSAAKENAAAKKDAAAGWDKPRKAIPPGGEAGQARETTDRLNFIVALDAIEARLQKVSGIDVTRFHDGVAEYDFATVAIIRLHDLVERPEYGVYLADMTPQEREGLRVTRNIAAHEYVHMDDMRFWLTVTRDVPELVKRLRAAVQ